MLLPASEAPSPTTPASSCSSIFAHVYGVQSHDFLMGPSSDPQSFLSHEFRVSLLESFLSFCRPSDSER